MDIFRACREVQQPKRSSLWCIQYFYRPGRKLTYSDCSESELTATPRVSGICCGQHDAHTHACYQGVQSICATTPTSSRFSSRWRTTLHVLASPAVPVQCDAPHSHGTSALAHFSINILAQCSGLRHQRPRRSIPNEVCVGHQFSRYFAGLLAWICPLLYAPWTYREEAWDWYADRINVQCSC